MHCLLALYALVAVAAAQGVGTPVHIIVLDAGNTSTQLKIFEETVRHSRQGPATNVKLIFSKPFYPGMKGALKDPNFMLGHLDAILSEAKKHIVSSYFEWTHLYVRATSDLRFLHVNDMELILQSCRDLLQSNLILNPFKFEPANVQLLAGEDEAAYTWLSANYLLGAFDRNRFHNETIGVMDMGNGSTEISFVAEEPIYSEKYPMRFHNKQHELYTQNYLQYGAESIHVKIHNVLLNRSHSGDKFLNPCLLKKDFKEVQLSDGSKVTHEGSGDPMLCEDILKEIVRPFTGDECHPKPCAIGRVYQPRVKDIQFYATVGFVYTPTALGVIDETKTLYLDRLLEAGRGYCQKTVPQVVASTSKTPKLLPMTAF